MRKRTLTVLASLAMVMSLVVPAGAASDDAPPPSEAVSGRYVVVMEDAPLVTEFGRESLDTPAARARGRALANGHEKVLEEVGLDADDATYQYTVSLNGFAVELSEIQVEKVRGADGVMMVLPDVMRYPQTDSVADFIGLTAPGGAYATGVDGEGVIVGVIDSGIWPEHPSFADDGSYPKPPALSGDSCQFGNTAHNADDAPFECNDKLIGARQMLETYRAVIGADADEFDSARDDDGHGTHTASTAAGNGDVEASMYGLPVGSISGIAPRAHVIAYKGLGNLGGFTSDLAAAIDQAVADGVDVINYSVGGGAGAPGADELAFLFASDAGVHVATSAGNSGPGNATLGNPATMPWLTTVGANTQSRFFEGTIVLGDGTEYTGASITAGVGQAPFVDAQFAGGALCIPGSLNPALVGGKIVLCQRGAVGRAAKSLAVSQAGGVGMVMYNTVNTDNLFTDTHWVPSVHTDLTPGLAMKNYIATAANPTAEIVTGSVSELPYAPSMTIFSSRGPNPVAPDIVKPDITAPGIQVLAGYSPFPDPGTTPPGELFGAIAGTSMSSPVVAGLFALIAQEHPDWSAAAARSALMTTADQDVLNNDRVTPANPFQMGSGMVDPGAAVKKGSAFQPGLVYDAGFLDYLGFLCDAFPQVFADPAATCASLAAAGVATDASDLNYPSIGVGSLPGTQTVTRTVTSVAQERGNRTYTVSVDAPDGFQVTVSPSTIRLRSGQSATYQVTITNVSAPIGAWTHGSLTWTSTGSEYSVYSPISVRPVAFSAPDAVTGSGESGSVDVPISFGYTGAYTAAGHGLEPATVVTDTVLQDPDQTFDPNDGFSNVHQVNVAGAALLRIAMPPEATEPDADLDIFVYGPGGAQVASSTAGGTEELIDLVLPADGTYSIYVHGWSAPGGDSPYDLFTWVVSATPGGNLTIDSAPASASIGTTATIEASWSGATAGQWHLGAVSHADGNGLLGLTLVEVDNR